MRVTTELSRYYRTLWARFSWIFAAIDNLGLFGHDVPTARGTCPEPATLDQLAAPYPSTESFHRNTVLLAGGGQVYQAIWEVSGLVDDVVRFRRMDGSVVMSIICGGGDHADHIVQGEAVLSGSLNGGPESLALAVFQRV